MPCIPLCDFVPIYSTLSRMFCWCVTLYECNWQSGLAFTEWLAKPAVMLGSYRVILVPSVCSFTFSSREQGPFQQKQTFWWTKPSDSDLSFQMWAMAIKWRGRKIIPFVPVLTFVVLIVDNKSGDNSSKSQFAKNFTLSTLGMVCVRSCYLHYIAFCWVSTKTD